MAMHRYFTWLRLDWLCLLLWLCFLGAKVDSINLAPILFKRLHIEGSTLRSRSVAYQADLLSIPRGVCTDFFKPREEHGQRFRSRAIGSKWVRDDGHIVAATREFLCHVAAGLPVL